MAKRVPTDDRPVVAWMGGSSMRPLEQISADERALVSRLFRDQMTIHADYWGNVLPRDTARIFWRRARMDAHATYRD